MKKTLALILCTAVIATGLCGCASENGGDKDSRYQALVTDSEKKEEKTTTTKAETTVTTADTDPEEPPITLPETKPTASDDKFIVPSGKSLVNGIIDESHAEDVSEKLFSNFDYKMLSINFLADSCDEVDFWLDSVDGACVKTLDEETFLEDIADGKALNVFYTFEMYNSEPASSVVSDSGEKLFASGLTLDGTEYAIVFGDKKVSSLEEAYYYTVPGTVMRYWALGTLDNAGNYILLPVAYGNDEYGCYAVRPSLALMGFDVTGMAVYTKDDLIDTPAETTRTADVDSDLDYSLHLTYADTYSDTVELDYSLVNGSNLPIWLDDAEATLNGVELGEDFSAYFEAPANGTGTGNVYIFNHTLREGDKLVITGEVVDTIDYNHLGDISFDLTFSK